MAKPELRDGYTQIANEILEKLAKMPLSPNQWRVLLFIIRKTYGFHKKVDYIANSQIAEATGLCKAVVSRCLKGLYDLKVISRKGKYIGFQKDWEQWEPLAIPSTLGSKLAEQSTSEKLAIPSTELAKSSTKVSSPAVTQKIKDTLPKNKVYIDILKLWNSLRIVQHRKLTAEIKRAISAALQSYSREEVSQAITNYAEILIGSQYYFSYRWTLRDFLKRGLEKFLDLEIARQNYLKNGGGGRAPLEQKSPQSGIYTFDGLPIEHDEPEQPIGSSKRGLDRMEKE